MTICPGPAIAVKPPLLVTPKAAKAKLLGPVAVAVLLLLLVAPSAASAVVFGPLLAVAVL